MKKQCNECKRNFSAELIQNLASNVNGELTYTPMCPICALADRNATFGMPADTPFTGTIAKAMHKQALIEVEQMRREGK